MEEWSSTHEHACPVVPHLACPGAHLMEWRDTEGTLRRLNEMFPRVRYDEGDVLYFRCDEESRVYVLHPRAHSEEVVSTISSLSGTTREDTLTLMRLARQSCAGGGGHATIIMHLILRDRWCLGAAPLPVHTKEKKGWRWWGW